MLLKRPADLDVMFEEPRDEDTGSFKVLQEVSSFRASSNRLMVPVYTEPSEKTEELAQNQPRTSPQPVHNLSRTS